MKHTKGPWKIQEDIIGASINIEGDGVWIGSVHKDHYTPGERCTSGFPGNTEGEANARLIASAPELLESCKMLRAAMRNHPGGNCLVQTDADFIDSAILKAEGESEKCLETSTP